MNSIALSVASLLVVIWVGFYILSLIPESSWVILPAGITLVLVFIASLVWFILEINGAL